MSAEQLRAKVRRILEGALNQGHLDALDELYAADLLYHRPPLADLEGLDAFRGFVADLGRSFSDLRLTIVKIVFEGDTHAGRWTLRGTHSGRSPIMPVPPTGRRVTITGCVVAHWAGGRIDEEWNHLDWLGLFQQLGVVPPMG